MNIKPISDLHDGGHCDTMSMVAEEVRDPDTNVLVIAGDLTEDSEASQLDGIFDAFCSRFPQVVYVPGNHEFWGKQPAQAVATLKQVAKNHPNLAVLDNEWFEYGGKRFFGGTLWYPLTQMDEFFFKRFSDGYAISGDRFAIQKWIQGQHARFQAELLRELKKGDIVISHHAPHQRSIHPHFENSPFNVFYANNLVSEVWEREPALWIHGHIHRATRYMVNATEVVANPRGWSHENTGFSPKLNVWVE